MKSYFTCDFLHSLNIIPFLNDVALKDMKVTEMKI